MTLAPTGFPAADLVSTSTAGSVGVQSGASTFLGPQTPPGARYGTSRGSAYLNLRPAGRTAEQTSVTTYTFERPTPSAGWTFVLGDIDADSVTITATDADGAPVDPVDLGYRSRFNYCTANLTPRPSCQPPNNNGTFLPTWNASTGVLAGDPQGRDTAGASAWFEPRVALTSLTFTYALRNGSPVYQTWFSALEYDLTGTVTAPAGRADGIEVQLLDPQGNEVATTRTGADGTYAFPKLATYDGYTVSVARPTDLVPDDGQTLSRIVDLGAGDAVEDFALVAPAPGTQAVSGTVRGSDGELLAGVTVTLSSNGPARTTVTDAAGGYVFDEVVPGTGYVVAATAPPNTTVSTVDPFDVVAGTSISDRNFVVTPEPRGALRGKVTRQGSNDPAVGELIIVSGPNGDIEVRTDADGTWSLDDLEPGAYTVKITPVSGDTVVGTSTRRATINSAGSTVGGLDFVLATPPVERRSAAGRVTDSNGDPVRGATVTAVDPFDGEKFTTTSGADGRWSIDGLYPDDGWTATVTPPRGYRGVGRTTRTFSLLGDDATGVDFVVKRTATQTSSPSSSPTAVSVSTDDGTLADTGGPGLSPSIGGLLLIVTGLAALRVRRHH